MQDRAVEPDRTGNIRVSMKRIEITAETINKGLARQGIDITYMIRRPIRQHCGCRTRLVFTAEPPITATESRHRHARQFFTAVRVDNITALVNDGSLALALVGDEVDLAAADNPSAEVVMLLLDTYPNCVKVKSKTGWQSIARHS